VNFLDEFEADKIPSDLNEALLHKKASKLGIEED
jgi:hypothetical protein